MVPEGLNIGRKAENSFACVVGGSFSVAVTILRNVVAVGDRAG